MRDAKNYVSDRIEYQQSGLSMAIMGLHNILVTDRQLYTDDYIAQAQKYYDEAVTLKPGVQSYDYIIDFCDEVNKFIAGSEKHLNFAILDEAIRAADAFDAFLKCAPDPAIENTGFNISWGTTLTFGDIAVNVRREAQIMQQAGNTIAYSELSMFSSLLYGNLLEAYNDVSNAILSPIADQVKDAQYIGYTGDKKSAYDDALNKYNGAMAAKNYEALPGAVSTLRDAAKAYAAAAEDYAKTEGKKQIPELKNKLTAIQDDIQAYSEYYNDTYPTEVKNSIAALGSADVATMNGRQIMDLLNGAKAVIAKQSESYSQKLKDTVSDAQSLTGRAGEWWSFLPDQMKAGAPYADAIALTNALTSAISGNGVYDLGALVKAYDAFVSDFNTAGGKIQTAAKATAQYVLDYAEEVYSKESDKKHTDGLLKAFRDAIDNLKSSIAAWDFDGIRAAAAAIKSAESKLLNDKPVQEETKAIKKSVKTGDMSNLGGVSLLTLLSMTTAIGILSKRRK